MMSPAWLFYRIRFFCVLDTGEICSGIESWKDSRSFDGKEVHNVKVKFGGTTYEQDNGPCIQISFVMRGILHWALAARCFCL